MTASLSLLWAAGVCQLLIASANFFAPKMLRYRDNLAKLSPLVREIFIVHCVYIVLILVAFALVCFGFAPELAGQSGLGRAVSAFLALFWGLRLLIQLFFYDAQSKRRHPFFHAAFVLTFVYLTATFSAAALGFLSAAR